MKVTKLCLLKKSLADAQKNDSNVYDRTVPVDAGLLYGRPSSLLGGQSVPAASQTPEDQRAAALDERLRSCQTAEKTRGTIFGASA